MPFHIIYRLVFWMFCKVFQWLSFHPDAGCDICFVASNSGDSASHHMELLLRSFRCWRQLKQNRAMRGAKESSGIAHSSLDKFAPGMAIVFRIL